jgi:hypothetical protein
MPWWKPFMMRCASNKGVMLRCIRVAEALVNNNENTSPRILRRRSKARADARLKLIAQPFLLFCAPHTNSAPAAADRGPKSSRNKQEQGVPELETGRAFAGARRFNGLEDGLGLESGNGRHGDGF